MERPEAPASLPAERDQRPPARPEPPEDLQPHASWPPAEGADAEALTETALLSFLGAAIDEGGLVSHNIEGYDSLLNYGIPQIVTTAFHADQLVTNERAETAEDRAIASVRVQLDFTDVAIGRPVYATYSSGRYADLYPNKARVSGIPYSAPLTLAMHVTLTANYRDGHTQVKRADLPPFQAALFPIMVGSNRCHTRGCPRAALKELEEDPNDPGGYFISSFQEWIVDLLENIRFNTPHVHKGMAANEVARAEFISQPGGAFENSSQVILRHHTSGQITAEINSTKFSKIRFPFYLLYRLFGMTSDREIVETVVFDLEERGPVAEYIRAELGRALHLADAAYAELVDELDREVIVAALARTLGPAAANPAQRLDADKAAQLLNTHLLVTFDRTVLPHVGDTAAARRHKLWYLGLVLRRMFLVELDVLPPTDRDHLRNKRVHGAGVSLAKAFKTQFNNSIVQPAKRALARQVKSTPFAALAETAVADTVRSAVSVSDLIRAMEQAIRAGNKTITVKRHTAVNRVSSQVLERKNHLNTLSSLRTVTAHGAAGQSKQTERADLMRRVHPSFPGYICVVQSADTGENVGMRKQLAISAGVCLAGDAPTLERRLRGDPELQALDAPDFSLARMAREGLARVFVNGRWIGCCRRAPELAARYRALRREGRAVDPRTSIHWDVVTGEVEFWLDVGRLTRPLLIVDSNIAAYDAARATRDPARYVPFAQGLRFTARHAAELRAGRLGLSDLVRAGLAEWVTPEEAEDCLIASSLEVLRAHAHDVTLRYTHCDVQQAILGLAALVSPYANHTQPARTTMATNQGRQTGGWYALSFPFRFDKLRFFQYYNQVPLVRTFVHRYVLANGTNVRMAYMTLEGYNMEDSAILSRASADRALFAGAFFRYERAELEKGEEFRNPDAATTKNLKPNASYEKLVDGFVTVGATVARGDALIGRVAKNLRPRDGGDAADARYLWVDRSIIYALDEPARVDAVLRPRGANDQLFGLVKLQYARPVAVGDKFSSRSGNKSIAALLLPQSDMPYNERGVTPDIIVNPHSIPSRMTIGQLLETTRAIACARRGRVADGTSFLPLRYEDLAADLAALGFRHNGLERMYNGATGEPFEAAIFVGPTFEQRLQKFVRDDKYVVGGSGPTDATTGQPLGGKNTRGGLRLGEMEAWCLEAHGAMGLMREAYGEDSDGRVLNLCRTCGLPAVRNERAGIYACRRCGEAADLAAVESTRSAIVFLQELAAANVKVRLGARPREFDS